MLGLYHGIDNAYWNIIVWDITCLMSRVYLFFPVGRLKAIRASKEETMDILLIDPPYTSLKGMSTDCGYNIGLTSLAAYLRNEGIETAVLMGDLLVDLPSNKTWIDC